MKRRTLVLFLGGALLLVLLVFALTACNSSGLSSKPRATFSQLSCLDINSDGRINAADAADAGSVPDFNADFVRDDDDGEYLRGVDIVLYPAAIYGACDGGRKREPEYLVAHDYFTKADVSCEPGANGVLVLGVAGGVDNLRDQDDAAGVRTIVDALIRKYEAKDVETIGVVAGSALYGAASPHAGMEEWLTNATRVYFERFPCLRLVMVGFSHGGVSVEVVGARLEASYANRIVAIVALDRIEDFYMGDLISLPQVAPIVNVYQRNSGSLGGKPIEAANALNFDASAELGPEAGNDGGKLIPVNHVTIDNSKAVRDWIVNVVIGRS